MSTVSLCGNLGKLKSGPAPCRVESPFTGAQPANTQEPGPSSQLKWTLLQAQSLLLTVQIFSSSAEQCSVLGGRRLLGCGERNTLFHLWEGTLCGTPVAEPLVTGEASGLHGWHFSRKRWAFSTGSSRRKQEGGLDSAWGSPCPVTCFGETMSISLKVLEGNWLQRQPRSMSCEKMMEMGRAVNR